MKIYKIQIWLWKKCIVYMHMHSIDNASIFCYVHERFSNSSNELGIFKK
jgi:hypothetical protein